MISYPIDVGHIQYQMRLFGMGKLTCAAIQKKQVVIFRKICYNKNSVAQKQSQSQQGEKTICCYA